MNKKTFAFFILISFLIWLIPFITRLLIVLNVDAVQQESHSSSGVVSDIFEAYAHNNRYDALVMIFFNNLKVAFINIAGGVFLGLGTGLNLIVNGFYTANVISNVHQAGMPVGDILKYILPHSFEMIGIWISGAIGFSLAKVFIDYIRFDTLPSSKFYSFIGLWIATSTLIILLAAYVEAYITVPST